MYTRIVVPLDGSTVSAQALPWARLVAGGLGASITLLQVVETLDSIPQSQDIESVSWRLQAEAQASWARLREAAVKEAKANLDKTAGPLRSGGLTVDTVVREGDAALTLIAEAGHMPDTLVVMSTHGRSGVGRWVMGSVTDKVVHHGHADIMVTRAQEGAGTGAPRVSGIVVPVDGSPMAEAAIAPAAAIAKAFLAPVTVVRVITPAMYGIGYGDYTGVAVPDQRLMDAVAQDARDYAEGVAKRIKAAGAPKADTNVVDGFPASAILDAATGAGKLVVMTTHGRSGVGRWVLGSIADHVVRHGTGPVLLVRPGG